MPADHDIKYPGAGRDLNASLFTPEGAPETKTIVILLHGGGWRVGSRGMTFVYGEALAARGYVALAAEYRLIGESPWPAQAEDVKAAIAWAQANAARLGCLAERVVVQGYSAGGHLALIATADLVEARAAVPAAVVAFFPPTELDVGEKGLAFRLIGESATEEAARRASPLHRVDPGFPPVFLLHGGADWTVAPEDSIALYRALRQAGAAAELHIFAGAQHEFSRETSMVAPVLAEVDLFLRRVVVEPARYAAETAAENFFAAGPAAFAKHMAEMERGNGA
jgi:acetyl esterase/lipase